MDKIRIGATVVYIAKSGQLGSGSKLHGVPGHPDEAVLLVGTAGVKVRLVDGEVREVDK